MAEDIVPVLYARILKAFKSGVRRVDTWFCSSTERTEAEDNMTQFYIMEMQQYENGEYGHIVH